MIFLKKIQQKLKKKNIKKKKFIMKIPKKLDEKIKKSSIKLPGFKDRRSKSVGKVRKRSRKRVRRESLFKCYESKTGVQHKSFDCSYRENVEIKRREEKLPGIDFGKVIQGIRRLKEKHRPLFTF